MTALLLVEDDPQVLRAEPAHGAPTLRTARFTLDLSRKELTLISGEPVS